jgi:hypothetical protein
LKTNKAPVQRQILLQLKNISIQSTGIGSARVVRDAVVGGSAQQATINKHDQTMEMTQEFLKSCPSMELTLDSKASPD